MSIERKLDRPYLRYTLTILIVVAAFGLRQVLVDRFGLLLPPFITLYPAITVVALLFGLYPGVLATLLAASLMGFWSVRPGRNLEDESFSDAISLFLFVCTGVCVSVVAEGYRRNQRRSAELSIKEGASDSAARLAAVVQSAPVGIVIHGPDGKILQSNSTARESFGTIDLAGGNLINASWRFVREDGSAMTPDEYPVSRVLATKEAVTNLTLGIRKEASSQLAWALVNALPRFDADGAVAEVAVAFMEITERKKAEEALRKSEERFRALITTSSTVVFTMKPDWRVMFHLAGENFISSTNLPSSSWTDKYIPPDEQQRLWAAIHQSIESKCAFELEHRVFRVDGSVGWTLSRAVPLKDARGDIVEWFGAATDITPRKRAEEALVVSQAFLQSTMDALSSHICVVDASGAIISANLAWRDFSQANRRISSSAIDPQKPRECLSFIHGTNYLDVCDTATKSGNYDAAKVAQAIREILKGDRQQFSLEYACHSPQEQRWFLCRISRFTATPAPLAVVEHINITERRLAEDALRESERTFTTLSNFIPQFVWMSTPDGSNVYFNQRWAEYTGLSSEQSSGGGWQTQFHPDDEPTARSAWTHSIQTGAEYRLEARIRAVDGSYRWFLVKGVSVRDAAGAVKQWFGTCTDIDDLKRAEEANREKSRLLSLALEASQSGYFERDLVNNASLWSPELERIFGIEPGAFNGQPEQWRAWIVPEDLPMVEDCESTAVRTGKLTGEWRIIRQNDGEVRWLCGHGVVLHDDCGKPVRLVGINLDITERKRAEEALLRSEKLASVGRMAAAISHEINNPLEAVSNLLFLTTSVADLPKSAHGYLEAADEELKRIAHVTRQSLGFYRESSKPEPTCLNQVLESAANLLKGKIKAKRAKVLYQLSENIHIVAVAGELRQVFANLLANSLDAIDQGGTIAMRASSGICLRHGFRCARVTIIDNGKGIPAESQAHIFAPFFTTKGSIGTGLGLWVSKEIIDKHHGTIRVRSASGGSRRGTAFCVVLPAEPVTTIVAPSCEAQRALLTQPIRDTSIWIQPRPIELPISPQPGLPLPSPKSTAAPQSPV